MIKSLIIYYRRIRNLGQRKLYTFLIVMSQEIYSKNCGQSYLQTEQISCQMVGRDMYGMRAKLTGQELVLIIMEVKEGDINNMQMARRDSNNV